MNKEYIETMIEAAFNAIIVKEFTCDNCGEPTRNDYCDECVEELRRNLGKKQRSANGCGMD